MPARRRRGASPSPMSSSRSVTPEPLSPAAAAAAKRAKMMLRTKWALIMTAMTAGVLWAGHLVVCVATAVLQCQVFRELVNVRYKAEEAAEVPNFRTVQWCIFFVAMFYTYGSVLAGLALGGDVVAKPQRGWLISAHLFVSFCLYVCVFVLTVLSFKKGKFASGRSYYRYQMGQLAWTVLTCCVVVIQMRYVVHNVSQGLFWWLFPSSLVIVNDTCAYFVGFFLGRKIINREFLSLSPNKTWEGFIGGGLLTCIYGCIAPTLIFHHAWMYCPLESMPPWGAESRGMMRYLVPELACEPPQSFQPCAQGTCTMPIPASVGYLFGEDQTILGYTMSTRTRDPTWAASRVRVEEAGYELGFMYQLEGVFNGMLPVQFHGILLAMFASAIAPFGGFFASLVKRAYNKKDFDEVIPGHGGIMDRMDCQFLISLCTYVHMAAFVRRSTGLVQTESVMAWMSSGLDKSTLLTICEHAAKLAGKSCS